MLHGYGTENWEKEELEEVQRFRNKLVNLVLPTLMCRVGEELCTFFYCSAQLLPGSALHEPPELCPWPHSRVAGDDIKAHLIWKLMTEFSLLAPWVWHKQKHLSAGLWGKSNLFSIHTEEVLSCCFYLSPCLCSTVWSSLWLLTFLRQHRLKWSSTYRMFINTVLHLENIIYKAEENIMTGLYQQFLSQPIYAAQDEGWGTNHRGIDTSGLPVNSSGLGGQLN